MTKKNTKVFITSDFHIPFHDNEKVNKLLDDIKKDKPDTLILNGDILDFYQLSTFSKNPIRLLGLQKDLDTGRQILKKLRTVMGNREIIYINGNHEARLQRYLQDNPELHSLNSLTIKSLLGLDELNIEFVSDDTKSSYIKYNGINIGHFNLVRKHAGMTALSLAIEKGGNYIQGHTHKLCVGFKRFDDRLITFAECGCMCNLTPEYCFKPDWCNGYLVMDIDEQKNIKIKPILL